MNTTARRPTDTDIAAAIAQTKREILADIGTAVSNSGDTMPPTIASFSELHDYVDPNCYGGLVDDDSDIDWQWGASEAAMEVQDTIDAWLKAGRPNG